jgi:Predicted endonuclease distantly related to archaeal Holliday junction resolvase
MPKTNAQITGAKGEDLACEFLIQKGFSIIDRNVHLGSYEIDIIAGDDTYILFVEVKTRIDYKSGTNYGSAASAVSKTKQKILVQAADIYMRKNMKDEAETKQPRIDVIEVYLPSYDAPAQKADDAKIKIRHIKNAIYRR